MAERTSPATLRSQPDYDASPTYLTPALPPRAGQRPRTESCLPHAQMEAESPDDVFEALTTAAAARPSYCSPRSASSRPSGRRGHPTA